MKTTKIEWADSTASPRRLKSKNFERDCRKLNKDAGKQYYNVNDRPTKVFPSLCDWLDPEVPAEWLADMLRVVHECPNLDFMLLTKRPELWIKRMNDANTHATFDADFIRRWLEFYAGRLNIGTPSNIWVGASCENREQADKRIPELLTIPAKVRFLSLEPLLGPIALSGTRPDRLGAPINFDWLSGIHWVIVGGESGHGARPCNIEWIRSIVRQCAAAGVPCFVKQLGSNAIANEPFGEDRELSEAQVKLKHPKGGDMAEWPEDLRVRQIPLQFKQVNGGAK